MSVRAAADGWSGGQYSVVRAAVGVWLAVTAGPGTQPAGALAALAALAFALGVRDRGSAAVLLLLWPAATGTTDPVALMAVLGPLLVHLTVPPAPYGSWDARGRTDPAGDWAVPDSHVERTWLVVGLVTLLDGGLRLGAGPSGAWALALLAGAALTVVPTARRPLWCALVGARLLALALGADPLPATALLVPLAWAVVPAWLPPSSARAPVLLFYDGTCGLCHRTVRFLLAEDRQGGLRFAPLAGPTCSATIAAAERSQLPDSMVAVTADGVHLVRGEGTIALLRGLGGLWRALGELLALLPGALTDRAYDLVARARRHLFRVPAGTCPTVPAAMRRRFADLSAAGPGDTPAPSAEAPGRAHH